MALEFCTDTLCLCCNSTFLRYMIYLLLVNKAWIFSTVDIFQEKKLLRIVSKLYVYETLIS